MFQLYINWILCQDFYTPSSNVDVTPSSDIYDVFPPVCDASNSMKDTGEIDDDDEAFASILDVH